MLKSVTTAQFTQNINLSLAAEYSPLHNHPASRKTTRELPGTPVLVKTQNVYRTVRTSQIWISTEKKYFASPFSKACWRKIAVEVENDNLMVID